MYPAVAPSSRYLHNMAAWPGGHAIVLFGGEHIKSRKSGKKKYARVNDVWAGVEINVAAHLPCSTAWRCRFLTARRSQHGRVIVEK